MGETVVPKSDHVGLINQQKKIPDLKKICACSYNKIWQKVDFLRPKTKLPLETQNCIFAVILWSSTFGIYHMDWEYATNWTSTVVSRQRPSNIQVLMFWDIYVFYMITDEQHRIAIW